MNDIEKQVMIDVVSMMREPLLREARRLGEDRESGFFMKVAADVVMRVLEWPRQRRVNKVARHRLRKALRHMSARGHSPTKFLIELALGRPFFLVSEWPFAAGPIYPPKVDRQLNFLTRIPEEWLTRTSPCAEPPPPKP